MEKTFKIDYNGQQIQKSDLELIGESAGLADDRVFAELMRLAPYTGTVARGILAYGYRGSAGVGTVAPNGATGTVLVNPFRAIIGARTPAATDAKKAQRDIRSALVVAEGDTSLTHTVSIASNASGNPRWDLVYAAVAVDANSTPTVLRKVKDPTTKVISSQTVSVSKVTSITLGVAAGTPGASPAYPATPADSAGTYYVPLAYIRVPNGFNGTSTVVNTDINEIATVIQMSSRVGGYNLRPSKSNVSVTGVGTSTQNGSMAWNAGLGYRAGAYMPPSMAGAEGLLIAIDVSNAANGNWSHQSGDVIDDTIDWRNRIFRWSAVVGADGNPTGAFPWIGDANHMFLMYSSSAGAMPGYSGGPDPAYAVGMGASFGSIISYICTLASAGASAVTPINGYNVPANIMASGSAVSLYVDGATGNLKLNVRNTPRVSCFIWLEATAPFTNR